MFKFVNFSKNASLWKNGTWNTSKTLTDTFRARLDGKLDLSSNSINKRKSGVLLQSARNRGTTAGYLSDPRNTGKPQSGVNFDTLGSWNNRLDLHVNIEQSVASGTLIPDIHPESIGVSSVIGRRKTNEDRTIVLELKSDLVLFAVFDGHGGEVSIQKLHSFRYI